MTTFKRYNPVLKNRLTLVAKRGDAEEMLNLLRSLSVSDFRTAGYLLAEEVLPTLGDELFWQFFSVVVPTNAKAYLGTFLKATARLYREHRLMLNEEILSSFAQTCSEIDKSKLLTSLLPLLRTPEEVGFMVRTFGTGQLMAVSAYLIKAHTVPCFYQLFLMLKMAEPCDVQRVVINVMKQGDALSYRMTSILKAYFGLEGLPVQLSFNIEDYQLNLLDQGYERFAKMMMR